MADKLTTGTDAASKPTNMPIDRDDLIEIVADAHQMARSATRTLKNAGIELSLGDLAALRLLARQAGDATVKGKLGAGQRQSLSKAGLISGGDGDAPATLTDAGRKTLADAEKAFDPLLEAARNTKGAATKRGVRLISRLARDLRKGARLTAAAKKA